MKYTHCRLCDEKIDIEKDKDSEHFFWCSKECKDKQQKEQLFRRRLQNQKHSRAAQRGEPDNWNELLKIIIHQAEQGIDSSNPSTDGTSKSGRKCGKCGGTGHNARTCKQQ